MRLIANRRTILAAGVVFLVVASAWHCRGQEAVLLKTEKGYIEFETRYSGKKSSPCTTANCSLSDTYVFESGESEQKAVLAASNFSISSEQTYYNSSQYGVSKAEYSMKLYSAVVPGSNLRVKVTGRATLTEHESFTVNTAPDGTETVQYWDNAGANVALSLDNSEIGGTLSVSDAKVSQGPAGSITRPLSVTAAAAAYPLAPEVKGGLKYYYVGTVRLNGRAGIDPATFWNGPKLRADASFNAKVEDIDIRYIGQALFYNGGGNQTWLVGEKLPVQLSVKVADGESGGLPDQQVDITFTMRGPDDTVVWSGTSKTGLADGTAKTDITLGALPGTYKITATCPAAVCDSGATEVIFTEYAKTRDEVTKLTEMFCDGAHFLGQKLSNPLRVKALNLYSNKGEEGLAVTFSPKEGSPRGTIHTQNTTTNQEGIAGTDFTLGNELKTHTVVAYCSRCLAGQTVECLVRSMYPPNANHNNPGVGIDKRRRGVSIALSPAEVYPQGTGSPVESAVTISGAIPNTTFTAQVVAGANTGGHQHHDPNRPKGTLAGHGSTTCTGSSPITCTTDANGGARLKYVSSAVGGWDTILVKMATGEEGDAIVKVRVPDLITLPLPNANYYKETNDGKHPNHYYGKQDLINGINQIATEYMRQYNAEISVNDMSLINGGVFDVNGNWVPKPHECHKQGMSVDFNRKHREEGKVIKVINMGRRLAAISAQSGADCRRIVEKMVNGKCFVHFECPSSSACQGEPGASCQEVCPKELAENEICAKE